MDKARLLIRLFSVFALLVAVTDARAQLTPATLGDPAAEKGLIRLIKFPETHGDASVMLQCLSIIKSNGRMKEAGCYIQNNWDPDFAAAVQEASKKALFVPAYFGNKSKDVVLLFQVEFLKTADDRTINVFLNPGSEEMVEEYGADHISPQRVLGKERWKDQCPKHARWMVFALAHVNEEGIASSIALEHRAGIVPTGPCQEAIIETVRASQFAPAISHGIAVPGSYVEPFGN